MDAQHVLDSIKKGASAGTALQVAATNGDHASVRLLLRLVDCEELCNALKCAFHNEHESVMRLLLEEGADCDPLLRSIGFCAYYTRSADGSKVYHTALPVATETFVRLLEEKGADLDEGVRVGAQYNNYSFVRLLLDSGASVGCSYALQVALDRGHDDILRLLVERWRRERVDVCPDEDFKIIAKQLLDVNAEMRRAASKGDKVVVRALLEKGANPNEGMRAAVSGGHESIVHLLLSKGANCANRYLLHDAIRNGHIALVMLLLDRNVHASYGLRAAVESQNVSMLQLLLGRGGNPNWVSDYVPRHDSYEAIMRLLLENGANPNRGVFDAIRNGNAPVLRLLLDCGADAKRVISMYGVAKQAHEALVGQLLARGFDPTLGTGYGHEAVLRLLEERK